MFTFVLKHSLFVYALFSLSLSLKGVLLYIVPIRVVLQPVFKFWMNVCLSVCVIISEVATGLIFSMLFSLTRINVSFYCDDLTLPNCPILGDCFCVCVCACVCVAFVFYFPLSQHWLVGFVLYGCWPCLDLMLPNPIPTEPLKIF